MRKTFVGLHRIRKQALFEYINNSKLKTQNSKSKNNMMSTTRNISLQQPARIGGLFRGVDGVAVEGIDPKILGCVVPFRHW
jgi:hypothetical protein